MSTKHLVATTLLLAAASASAEPKHSMMVFRADGNADPKLRAKIDASILVLAKKATDATVQGGDISFADAAAAAGCKPETPTCKDDVIATFAVDEIVIVSAARKPGVTEVTVRRAMKGQPPREATVVLKGDGDTLDPVAPLFGGAPPPATPPTGGTPPPPTGGTPTPTPPETKTVGTTGGAAVEASGGVTVGAGPTHTAPPRQVAQPTPHDTVEPGPVDAPPPKRGLYIAGMIGGGVLGLVGIGMWGAAADLQGDIDAADKKTKADFNHLTELEARGDRLATTGNVLFFAGAVLGGVSAYFYIKRGRAARDEHHAMITPTLVPGGAGIALTWGAP